MCPGNKGGAHNFQASPNGVICCQWCGCAPLVSKGFTVIASNG